MPKQTFLNLEEVKKRQIIDAFLREFALKAFDEASLTEVVKHLGIAKGSIYQYFADKMDLFKFLVQECTKVKMNYAGTIERQNYPDFWSWFRDIFDSGFQFDNENPLQSHFLHNLIQNLNSPSVKNLYKELINRTVSAFEEMVRHEIELNLFRDDIPVETMGFLLYKVGAGIREQLEFSGGINPKESIQNNKPVYQGKKEVLMKIVDDYIRLVKPAFDKH
jgi:AcrR family transcriptional regulator